MFSFDVSGFLHKPEGYSESFDFNEEAKLEETSELGLHGKISGRVKLLKLPHEINVSIKDIHATGRAVCSRCLKPFECKINIPLAEREFIIDLSERDLSLGEDVFYVNKDKNTIELLDMIREEILLQFPHIPVCSEGCKGLCDRCGANLNEKECSCPRDVGLKSSPFKFLKS